MRWLDDLIALAEAKSLNRAAELRVVTQPAFTRRVQQIERWLGVPVLDRSRRPVQLTPAIQRRIEDIRALSNELRYLRADVRDWETAQRRVSLAAQHSLCSGVLARFVATLRDGRPAPSIRLRAANRDDCYTLLMTRQVAMMVAFEVAGMPMVPDETLVERREIGEDELCPVAAPDLWRTIDEGDGTTGDLPIIAFTADSFFGELFARRISPNIRQRRRLRVVCDTAFVPAALVMAAEGAGVAWLPRTLCDAEIRSGRLIELDDSFAPLRLNIVETRLASAHPDNAEIVWDQLFRFMRDRTQSAP
jgi:DNA-binding transcriptional LysR family regulator